MTQHSSENCQEQPDPITIHRLAVERTSQMNPTPENRPIIRLSWMALLTAKFAGEAYFRRRGLKQAIAALESLRDQQVAERLAREQLAAVSGRVRDDYLRMVVAHPRFEALFLKPEPEQVSLPPERAVEKRSPAKTFRRRWAIVTASATLVAGASMLLGIYLHGRPDNHSSQAMADGKSNSRVIDFDGADIVSGADDGQAQRLQPSTVAPARSVAPPSIDIHKPQPIIVQKQEPTDRVVPKIPSSEISQSRFPDSTGREGFEDSQFGIKLISSKPSNPNPQNGNRP